MLKSPLIEDSLIITENRLECKYFFLGHAEYLLKNSLTATGAIRSITATRLATPTLTRAVVRAPIATNKNKASN